jgi:RNA polymerase sigma-70 factor, ECF subfamily
VGQLGHVQDAFCRAIEKRDQFRGASEEELVRWLQRILANTVKDKIAAARAEKRDLGRVQSLEQAVTESSVHLDAFLAAEQSSPSEQADAARCWYGSQRPWTNCPRTSAT